MKFTKLTASLATAAALTLSAGSAQAITVGGVQWDPAYDFDFASNGSVYESTTTVINETISGHGTIDRVNGSNDPDYYCNGCEITYTFGGFKLIEFIPGAGVNGFGGSFAFTGGWVNVYVDYSTTAFDPAIIANSGDGTLWLSLVAVSQPTAVGGATLTGALFDARAATLAGAGGSYLNVTGGVAAAYLDTNNAKDQCVETGGLFCPDMYFNSDFSFNRILAQATEGALTHSGSSDIEGRSQEIPEPGIIALLGLGLMGIGAARRNKKTA